MVSRLPPGPARLPLFGAIQALRKNPLQLLADMARYGDLSYARLGPTHIYFVNHPSLIEEVLVGRHSDLIKGASVRALMPLIGSGLLTGEGELWRHQRRLTETALSPKRVARYLDTMISSARHTAASLRDHDVRDIYADMSALTMEITGKTLLGFDPRHEAERMNRIVDESLRSYALEVRTPLGFMPAQVMTPARKRLRQSRLELESMLLRIIARCRRSDPDQADHLLARLTHARDENGEAMSDRQLLDEAVTMLIAGHETTALALCFALYLLSEHPHALERARAELDAVVGRRGLEAADLPRLTFLDAVLRETLRLYPPAYAINRETLRTIELDGYEIGAGAQLFMSQSVVHRDARFFPEPEQFKPERWLDPGVQYLPRFAYFPFGGGPRVCVGGHFAMLEATLVLATLIGAVDLQVAPGFALDLEPSATLRPRQGFRMLVRRRKPATLTPVSSAA